MNTERRQEENKTFRKIYKMIKEEMNERNNKIETIYKKLFEGNGKPSWSSRLDSLEKSTKILEKALIWVISITCSFLIVAILKLVIIN